MNWNKSTTNNSVWFSQQSVNLWPPRQSRHPDGSDSHLSINLRSKLDKAERSAPRLPLEAPAEAPPAINACLCDTKDMTIDWTTSASSSTTLQPLSLFS